MAGLYSSHAGIAHHNFFKDIGYSRVAVSVLKSMLMFSYSLSYVKIEQPHPLENCTINFPPLKHLVLVIHLECCLPSSAALQFGGFEGNRWSGSFRVHLSGSASPNAQILFPACWVTLVSLQPDWTTNTPRGHTCWPGWTPPCHSLSSLLLNTPSHCYTSLHPFFRVSIDSDGKESALNAGHPGLILGLEDPQRRQGCPLQYSCLRILEEPQGCSPWQDWGLISLL